MRLIDADAFLERFEAMCETKTDSVIAMVLRGALVDEPTAYDVDKVVEQLEEFRDEMKMFGCDGLLSDLIEVVKGGGVDAGGI